MKKVLLHLCAWLAFYSAISISAIIHYDKTPWLVAFYNYISLAGVFYAFWFLVKSYYEKVSLWDGLAKYGWHRFYHFVINWYSFGILAVLIGNILLSWKVDNFFHRLGMLPGLLDDFWYYSDGKFARESFFACMGGGGGLLVTIIREKNAKILFQQQQMKIIVREKNNVVNFYNQEIKVMKAMLKRLNDHDSETGTDG